MNKKFNSLLLDNPELDAYVNDNFNNLRLNSLFLPLLLLLLILLLASDDEDDKDNEDEVLL